MSEPIYKFDGSDPAMRQAKEAAQRSFKYFWRELSWEYRRIIPALEMAAVKLEFSDGPRTDENPESEHMWVGDVDFDGEMLSGRLLNSPNWLTSVREGDAVTVPFARLEDWMITNNGRAYGGFSVNLMRSKMSFGDRKQHDDAWGLDFGDPNEIKVELEQGAKPKRGFLSALTGSRGESADKGASFRDHPMCVNMAEKIEKSLKDDASAACAVDELGWTLLHREALAGNFGVVKLLVRNGAAVNAKTAAGKTAADLARGIGWPEIADYLDAQSKS
jgi:uncharacterized protein YegJ (DUF2314 family)